MVLEAEVGITEYASDAAPIAGILRHRYTDFKVNEIDHQMNIARITCMDAPAEEDSKSLTFCDAAAVEACVAVFAEEMGKPHAEQLQAFLEQLQRRVRL
jgi:hypothetical protein